MQVMTEADQLKETLFYGAQSDLAGQISSHLFVICPNNSGSTFVTNAIAKCKNVWRLAREGQHMLGYSGPDTLKENMSLTWAKDDQSVKFMSDPKSYDWKKTKEAWYFQASSLSQDADVLLIKTPPFLLITDHLASEFHPAKFIFMVRNPYASVEGILRRTSKTSGSSEAVVKEAANHILNCFEFQKMNVGKFRNSSVFFTYEDLCSDPKSAAQVVKTLVPSLADLDFDQTLAVKGMYNEPLRNMNADQLSRLSEWQYSRINEVFAHKLDVLQFFGYDLMYG